MKAKLTDHAIARAKDRFKMKPNTLQRLANKALTKGVDCFDMKDDVGFFLQKSCKVGQSMRVYGDKVFVFGGRHLVTVYSLHSVNFHSINA